MTENQITEYRALLNKFSGALTKIEGALGVPHGAENTLLNTLQAIHYFKALAQGDHATALRLKSLVEFKSDLDEFGAEAMGVNSQASAIQTDVVDSKINSPKNLAEATAMLIDIIPTGCYAELMGSWVWVEQVAENEFAVISIPIGESISNLNWSAWDEFDEEHGWVTVESINSWMTKPVFGLLRTIVGFGVYPRRMFVVSNKGTHPMQQHEEWRSWVMDMYTCVRKYDSRIPDTALDVMRDALLQK